MRRKLVLRAAAAAYVAAWFTQSVAFQRPFPESLPGWSATAVAFAPLSDLSALDSATEWLLAIMMVASALTNALFLAALFVAFRRPYRLTRGLEWAIWGAALLNTHWLLQDHLLHGALRAGYYLWVLSFVLLAAGIHRRRLHPGEAPRLQPAA